MKAEIVNPPKSFVPVTIALTFDTQLELDAFGCLMNYSPAIDTFNRVTNQNTGLPYPKFKEAGARLGLFETEYAKRC